MIIIPAASSRTRTLGLTVLLATFIVGGLTGMALQQTRIASGLAAEPADSAALMVPFGPDGELRPCPPRRQRYEPYDSLGLSDAQRDSIRSVSRHWEPKLRSAFGAFETEYEAYRDSLFKQYEDRADAIRDSLRVQTRAVLTPEQLAKLQAMNARRDSAYRAMRDAQDAFEDACRDARRQNSGDAREGRSGDGRDDRTSRNDDKGSGGGADRQGS